MKYEVRLSNVPDGARDEWYLGVDDRETTTLAEARAIVRSFRSEFRANPDNFEPDMEPRILRLSDGQRVQ